MFRRRSFSRAAASLSRSASVGRRGHSTSIPDPGDTTSPLFRYTSGRWLWNEAEQLAARSRRFDVPGLQRAACRAVGASRCASLEKIGEGNDNKAFRLVMDDDRSVVAKIPHPRAGPPTLTTASEVATMEFARDVLGVPVPKVLSWSATDQNPVGAEYIIMEEARGRRLHEVWQTLSLRAKCDVIRNIVEVERKMLSISFNKIGSLYFNDGTVPGCKPATVVVEEGNDLQRLTESIRSRFCVGPIVRRKFWEKERKDMHQYHGPWASAVQYLESLARREMDWIRQHADPNKSIQHPWQYTSSDQHSPEAHVAALEKFLAAISLVVPRDPSLCSARLWHPDFHAGNIYVDDQGCISSIIDWQGAWTTPVFIGASPPSLLDYGVDMLMKLPDNFKELDEATKDQLRYQVSQSILIHTYEAQTATTNPLMHKMMRYPHGQTLKQLEAFAGSTWDNCLYPLQHCLIIVEREWEHFGSDAPCPFHFSADEIQKHQKEADTFNRSQELWASLRGVVTDEGYATHETYDGAVEAFKELRVHGLAALDGEERDEFERMTCWVEELR